MTAVVVDVDWMETTGRRLEIAQIVWQQALATEADDAGDDGADADDDKWSRAFALSQLARHERAALEHALSHGRAVHRDHGSDGRVVRAVRTLEAAIALAKPGGSRRLAVPA